jgi:hypothetical protein
LVLKGCKIRLVAAEGYVVDSLDPGSVRKETAVEWWWEAFGAIEIESASKLDDG